MLVLYDWMEQEVNCCCIEGVQQLICICSYCMYKGVIISGYVIQIDLLGSYFVDEGDLCFFGVVLCEFFCLYVLVNVYVDLMFRILLCGILLYWKCDIGVMSVF